MGKHSRASGYKSQVSKLYLYSSLIYMVTFQFLKWQEMLDLAIFLDNTWAYIQILTELDKIEGANY